MNEILSSNSTPSASISTSVTTESLSRSSTSAASNLIDVHINNDDHSTIIKEDNSNNYANNGDKNDQSMSDDEEGGLVIKEDSDSPSMHSACDQPFCDQIKQMDIVDEGRECKQNDEKEKQREQLQQSDNDTVASQSVESCEEALANSNNSNNDVSQININGDNSTKSESKEVSKSADENIALNSNNNELVAINDSNNNLHLNVNVEIKRRSSAHSNSNDKEAACNKSNDPFEEDIIDGFAILSFKYLQDLKKEYELSKNRNNYTASCNSDNKSTLSSSSSSVKSELNSVRALKRSNSNKQATSSRSKAASSNKHETQTSCSSTSSSNNSFSRSSSMATESSQPGTSQSQSNQLNQVNVKIEDRIKSEPKKSIDICNDEATTKATEVNTKEKQNELSQSSSNLPILQSNVNSSSSSLQNFKAETNARESSPVNNHHKNNKELQLQPSISTNSCSNVDNLANMSSGNNIGNTANAQSQSSANVINNSKLINTNNNNNTNNNQNDTNFMNQLIYNLYYQSNSENVNSETVNKKKVATATSSTNSENQLTSSDSLAVAKSEKALAVSEQFTRQLSNSSSKDDVILLSVDTNDNSDTSKKATSTSTTTKTPATQTNSNSTDNIEHKNHHHIKDLNKQKDLGLRPSNHTKYPTDPNALKAENYLNFAPGLPNSNLNTNRVKGNNMTALNTQNHHHKYADPLGHTSKSVENSLEALQKMGVNPAAHPNFLKNNMTAFNSMLPFMNELKPDMLVREMNNRLLQQMSGGKAEFPLMHSGDAVKSNNPLNSLNNSKVPMQTPGPSSTSASASANQSFLRDFELSLGKQNMTAALKPSLMFDAPLGKNSSTIGTPQLDPILMNQLLRNNGIILPSTNTQASSTSSSSASVPNFVNSGDLLQQAPLVPSNPRTTNALHPTLSTNPQQSPFNHHAPNSLLTAANSTNIQQPKKKGKWCTAHVRIAHMISQHKRMNATSKNKEMLSEKDSNKLNNNNNNNNNMAISSNNISGTSNSNNNRLISDQRIPTTATHQHQSSQQHTHAPHFNPSQNSAIFNPLFQMANLDFNRSAMTQSLNQNKQDKQSSIHNPARAPSDDQRKKPAPDPKDAHRLKYNSTANMNIHQQPTPQSTNHTNNNNNLYNHQKGEGGEKRRSRSRSPLSRKSLKEDLMLSATNRNSNQAYQSQSINLTSPRSRLMPSHKDSSDTMEKMRQEYLRFNPQLQSIAPNATNAQASLLSTNNARMASNPPFAATPTMHTQSKNPISYAGRDLFASDSSFERAFNFSNAPSSLLPQFHGNNTPLGANNLPYSSSMLSDARIAEQYRLSLLGNEQSRITGSLDPLLRSGALPGTQNFAPNFGQNLFFDKQQFQMQPHIPAAHQQLMNMANMQQHLQSYPSFQHSAALFGKDRAPHTGHIINPMGLNEAFLSAAKNGQVQIPSAAALAFSQQNHSTNSPPVSAVANYK